MTQLTSQLLAAMLDAAPDATVCVDGDGRITLVNAQAERQFGYGRDELVGQAVEVLIPDAVKAGHPALRAGYTADPQAREMGAGIELSGRRRDGSTFPAEVSLSALSTGDGTLVMAAVRDVTVRREQQARARQHTAELEQANKNLESFNYAVAHDLRGPLRGLSGFSELLVEDYGEALGETGRGYAERIQAACERMATLVEGLLQLSRVSNSDLNPRPLDLSAEAAAIAAGLQAGEPDRQVRFTIADGVTVTADGMLMRTVLQHLLGNAWKFTGHRDEAAIEFGATTTAADGVTAADGARVCCYVRDNGAGFDPAFAGKLFQPFQRLHAVTEFPGTGIGLATVQRIIERHGGRVWAHGAAGEGATFSFTLDPDGSR
jgi:PAS domain S-box-containing protein